MRGKQLGYKNDHHVMLNLRREGFERIQAFKSSMKDIKQVSFTCHEIGSVKAKGQGMCI